MEVGAWVARSGLFAVLVLLACLGGGERASAGKYSVVQCGWGVGKDADWGENASQRYNHSAHCVPSGSDVWSGVEIRTYTRPAAGSAAAATTGRWRWLAPADTKITNVRGTWWHELHNHFQHRLGGMQPNGNFHLAHSSSTSRGMQAFAAGFGSGVLTFESRLICARPEPKRCDTSPSSAAMVRALTITLQDDHAPLVGGAGSALAGGWLRGKVEMNYSASDRGGGMRFAETLLDGGRAGFSEHSCQLAQVGGIWHGRRMLPCPLQISGRHAINTVSLSDGPHTLQSCVTDFAGNRGCTTVNHIKVDNSPPAAPLGMRVVGGDQWRRQDSFDLAWSNPSQGAGSPIVGATYRVTGPDGFDTGSRYEAGQGITKVGGIALPKAGEYRVSLRLHDQAGNSTAANVGRATLRFDDVPPEVGFRGFSDVGMPERIRARIFDSHSGPASGTIAYRRVGAASWTELPASLESTGRTGEADLVARFPSDTLEPDRYEFRVVGLDAAGNRAESNRRIDGGVMLAEGPLKTPTRLEAQIEVGGQADTYATAGFLAQPVVTGRLSKASGEPLGGRELRVLVTPEAGATTSPSRYRVVTGEGGEFSFQLGRSVSRRVEVRFAGDDRLAASRAPDLSLRVAGAVRMRAKRTRVVTGTPVRFFGQVDMRDARVPAGGKLVSLQYRDRRARVWRPVMFVRSGIDGRVRARYRFRFITRPTVIRMRAVALAEPQWPYAVAASKPFNIRVLPRGIARKRAARAARRKARRAALRMRQAPGRNKASARKPYGPRSG